MSERLSVEKQIFAQFIADPNLHEHTDLGRYYRMGYEGIRCTMNSKQRAAYNAGRRAARSTPHAR